MDYTFNVSLQKKILIAKDTYEVYLNLSSDGFHFKPGQYIWLVIPELNSEDPKGNRRAFSIASSQSQTKEISIIFRIGESHYKKFLLALHENSPLQIIGPFGSEFVMENVHDPEIVIIAGGTGIVPFLSVLRADSKTPESQRHTIIFINSVPEEAFFIEELNEIAKRKNYGFISITNGRFSWDDVPKNIDKKPQLFFICGPQGMVDNVTQTLLINGVKKDKMKFEGNYPTNPGNLNFSDIEKFISDKNNLGLRAFQQSNQHFIITDENGIILFANEAAQKITGFTYSEMEGNSPRLWGGLMSPQFYKDLWSRKQKSEAFAGQITNRRKNGEIYQSQTRISPITGVNDQVIGYVATEEDITQRVLLEENLKNEKAKVEAILSSIGDGIIVTDNVGKIILVNKIFEQLLYWKPDEVIGKDMIDVVVKFDENDKPIPREKRSLYKVLQEGYIKGASVH